MKLLSVILLLVSFSSGVYAQSVVTNTDQPDQLYRRISDAISQDKPKLAIQHFKQVIDFYTTQNRESEIPQNYFGMALAFAFSGHYKESIRYHKKAIRAHRRYRAQEEPMEMVLNLGLTYELAGKNRKARRIMNI